MIKNFQKRIAKWVVKCFSVEISKNVPERNHRFLEEALELVQSLGCTKQEAQLLVDYVYSRPLGEPSQEVGGVSVTLAALCHCNNIDLHDAAYTELKRIESPAVMEKIRIKQMSK